jgi:hypothetical protein
MCSGGSPSGTLYILNATDVTPVIGSYYSIYAPTVVGSMDGTNCWYVVTTTSSTPDGDAAFGTEYFSCICGGSPTPSPTPPPTPPPPTPSYFWYVISYCTGGTDTVRSSTVIDYSPAYFSFGSYVCGHIIGDSTAGSYAYDLDSATAILGCGDSSCSPPPPPSPPPSYSYDYYDYEDCNVYGGPVISIQVLTGAGAPLCIVDSGTYYTKYDGVAYSSPNQPVSYTWSSSACYCA